LGRDGRWDSRGKGEGGGAKRATRPRRASRRNGRRRGRQDASARSRRERGGQKRPWRGGRPARARKFNPLAHRGSKVGHLVRMRRKFLLDLGMKSASMAPPDLLPKHASSRLYRFPASLFPKRADRGPTRLTVLPAEARAYGLGCDANGPSLSNQTAPGAGM